MNPWKTKGSEVKYSNPWITVIEDKVVRPDGKDGIYGVVDIGAGVAVLPIDDEGTAYMIEQFRYPLGRKLLDVPCGVMEGNETPIEAAKRELKEELGIEAEEWTDLGVYEAIPGVIRYREYLFMARKLKFGESNLDGNESLELVKMPFKDVIEKVLRNEVKDEKTALLLLLADRKIRHHN